VFSNVQPADRPGQAYQKDMYETEVQHPSGEYNVISFVNLWRIANAASQVGCGGFFFLSFIWVGGIRSDRFECIDSIPPQIIRHPR